MTENPEIGMKRVAWLTDVHLNFLDERGRGEFFDSVRGGSPDAVLVSGDIAESPDVVQTLHEMAATVRRPIYFVLGNHDFYRGSIAATREAVSELAAGSECLVYLSDAGVIELTATTAVVGHDGWGDARLGDFENSTVMLNDFFLIDELKKWCPGPLDMDRPGLRSALSALGDEAAAHFGRALPEALEVYHRVIAVTHVAPFGEASWHEGKYSDDDWLPFFACKAVGDVMLEQMRDRPDRELVVLCGHTHGSGETQILPNLRVLSGGAKYREPAVQRIFEFE